MLSRYPVPLRQEVFQKVERQYMLGLRAKDPEVRQRFFILYHESLGKTLFNRLHFIIQIQDWEAVSDAFWLKQGLDLLLAILVENEPIMLAPNSARVPPLLASGTFPDMTVVQHSASDISDCSDGASLTFDSLVARHAQFLTEMCKLQVGVLAALNCLTYFWGSFGSNAFTYRLPIFYFVYVYMFIYILFCIFCFSCRWLIL